MTSISLIDPGKYQGWNDQLKHVKGATFFHTSNWARVICDTYSYYPVYFSRCEHERMTGVIPIIEVNSWITGKRGICLPFTDQCEPLFSDERKFNETINFIVQYGKRKKWKSLYLHGGGRFFDISKADASYVQSEIELDEDPAKNYASFKTNTKRNIAKAEKSGLIVRILRSKSAIADFDRLNSITRKKHGLPPQPFIFFKHIQQHVLEQQKGFVCLAYNNEVPVAGVVFFYFNKKAIYKYGASNPDFLTLRPNNLVMWEAIKWCSLNGIKYLDLGRTEPQNVGLLNFKRGWNARERKLYYFKLDIQKNQLISGDNKIKSSYGLFKKMPIPILRFLGNLAYRHIA